MGLQIKHVTVGKWNENCYLIRNGSEGWLIDPGDNFALIDEELGIAKMRIHGIINTHGHFDHLGAVDEFKTKYNLPFYLHSRDKQIARQANLYRRLAGDTTVFTTPKIDIFLDDIQYLPLGQEKIFIHHMPGHSPGSVCFEIANCLVSGDIIFNSTIGRTDLPGGNNVMLGDSVEYLIKHFAGHIIYPGHGASFVLDETVIEKIKKR